jgi:long-subunit fatty acid transport protein
MNRKYVLIVLSVVLLSGSLFAGDFSKTGTAGAQFLKIGVGARYTALGEASVATSDDIYSMYWNPAGLTYVEKSQAAFTYVNYVTDVNLNYVAFAHRFEGIGVFGASATVLSMNDQEITTIEEPEGTGEMYSASSYAFQVSFARQMTSQFSFGISCKYLGEQIYNEKANGIGFDFGTMLYTGYRSLRLGMSISNMGQEMKFDGPDLDIGYTPESELEAESGNQDAYNGRFEVNPYDLPLTFRVGLAYDWDFTSDYRMTFSVEAKHPNDNLEQGSFGLELDWKGLYFLRAGYKLNYEEEGLGLGGGLQTRLSDETNLFIDYAWVDFGRFDSVHRFSAGLAF